jgi:hypothetical protein
MLFSSFFMLVSIIYKMKDVIKYSILIL